MIIELVGLPGSGKSTFARNLASKKKYKRVKIKNPIELIWYNWLFSLRFPVTFIRLLGLYFTHAGPRSLWYTKFTSVFLDYNAKYMKARRVPYAILDQGHLQILLSLFDEVLSKKKFEKVVSLLPKSDHYIFFAPEENLRLSQLEERGYQSRQGLMTDEERNGWQATASSHFLTMLDQSIELAPATVEVFKGVYKLSEMVEKYQNTNFMRYITFARMPTEKAHGLQIAKMCEAFTELGYFVSLFTPKRKNTITDSITNYYQLKQSLVHKEVNVPDIIGSTRRVTQLHHYLHEILFAVAVFFMPVPKEMIVYTRTPLVAKIGSWRGRKVVAEQHYWPGRGQKLTAWLLKDATLVANSEGTRDALRDYGLEAEVAHNGFPAEWLEIDISKEEVKNKLGLSGDLPVVMYIGSLGDWKGVNTLCEAGRLLKNEVQTVVIGGSGENLENWKKRYPGTVFLGEKPYYELGENQKAADILVVPNNPEFVESEKYTSPIKLFAHLASGRPVVVSDLPTMRAIVDKETAWFFTPGNHQVLIDMIRSVISDSDRAKKISENALEFSLKYTWKERAKKIKKIFNEEK